MIWLIRHGETTASPGLAIGASDPPLSARGQAQAEALAAELSGRRLTRVFSSDLSRAVETARIVAAPHGLPVETTSLLREIDFGSWEGKALSDLWVTEPAAAERWERDIRSTPSGFAETLDELERRVLAFWGQMRPRPAGADVAVVAHRGPLAVLRALITGLPVTDTLAEPLEVGRLVRVEWAKPRRAGVAETG